MTQVLSKDFIKRLINDVKYLKNNPLNSNGIYYIHDDDNLMIGYALVIGPQKTVYENGFYFFKFDFTPSYPHEPPIVTFMTNGGNVRFNPNLYTNGKVCISLLNTWTGEQWTSCQTISTILLTLCTLLNDNPLLNEPEILSNNKNIQSYDKLLLYSNLNIAVCDVVNENSHIHFDDTQFFNLFRDVILNNFFENYQSHILKIKSMILNCIYDSKIENVNVPLYHFKGKLNYIALLTKMQNTFELVQNLKAN
jgi:ubiquitin-conjugating enzyme E2 Z